MRSSDCEMASRELLKISRAIDSELARANDERVDICEFSNTILRAYDVIIDHTPLPWFIKGEQQLANLSLIQSFTRPRNENVAARTSDVAGGAEPVLLTTDADRAVGQRLRVEMARLGVTEGMPWSETLTN